jgi:hypothetical protein
MRKGLLVALAILGVLAITTATAVADQESNLKFKTLPSAQGWTYADESCCPPATESSVYSLSDRTLIQDSRGTTGFPHYELPGVPDSDGGTITLSMRARVTDEVLQGPPPNSFGFSFNAQMPDEIFGIGIGTHRIEDANSPSNSTTAIDNTVFHDYVLRATPGVGYELYVDDVLTLSGPPRTDGPFPHRVYFGDGTGGAGARAEIVKFHWNQAGVEG